MVERQLDVRCPACGAANRVDSFAKFVNCESCGSGIDVQKVLRSSQPTPSVTPTPTVSSSGSPYLYPELLPTNRRAASSSAGNGILNVLIAGVAFVVIGAIGAVIFLAGGGSGGESNANTPAANNPSGVNMVAASSQQGFFDQKLTGELANVSVTTTHAVISTDNSHILTVSEEGAFLWDSQLRRLREVAPNVEAATLNPAASTVAVVKNDQIQLYEVSSGNLTNTLSDQIYRGPIAFMPNSADLVTVNTNGDIRIVKAADGGLVVAMASAGTTAYRYLTVSQSGNYVAAVANTSRLLVWNASDGRLIYVEDGVPNVNQPIGFSADGRSLAVMSTDSVSRYTINGDAVTKVATLIPNIQGYSLRSVAYSPNGAFIVAADNFRGQVFVWKAADGAFVRTIQGSSNLVGALAFAPDSSALFGVDSQNNYYYWTIR